MSDTQTVAVKCWCGWRGRRIYQFCECDTACSHTGYGYCPKCRAQVNSVAKLRETEKVAAETEAWANSPAGREALAKVLEKVGLPR